MKKKRKTKKPNKTKSVNKSTSDSKRHIGIIIATIVLIGLIAAFIFLFPRQDTVAGQAFHQTEAGKFVVIGDQGVQLSFAKGHAAVGDTFDLTLKIKTGGKNIGQINFKMNHPSYSVVGTTAKSALKTITTPGADGVWSVWDAEKKVTGDVDIITFKMKLNSGAVDSTQKITVNSIELVESGSSQFGPFTAEAAITVAEKCVDNDNDKYGKKGTDLRACGVAGDKAGTTNFDCEDDPNNFGAKITPGKKEDCDLLDNNCNGKIDEGLSGAANSKLQGVCYGTKVCKPTVKGQSGWIDSYLVDDTNIKFNNEKQFALYEKDTETKCDLYDNDCDGFINEDITCDLKGAGGGLAQTSGDSWFSWSSGKYDANKKTVNSDDLFGVFVLKDTYTATDNKPQCLVKDAGHLCYCKNGNYYYPKSSGGWFFVDYAKQTRESAGFENYKVVDKAGNFVLQDGQSKEVTC